MLISGSEPLKVGVVLSMHAGARPLRTGLRTGRGDSAADFGCRATGEVPGPGFWT